MFFSGQGACWYLVRAVNRSTGSCLARCLSGAAVHATVIFSAPDKNVNKRIEVVQNDLTKENVDAIVNAANSWLKHGGGVAGAIVKNGGYQIQTESDEYVAKHGPIKTGGIAVTKPGNLPCNIIIHAVGKFSCMLGMGWSCYFKLKQVQNSRIIFKHQLFDLIMLPQFHSFS
ncbi:poly [ADP-ribose] polymerase 9-like [Stylophora pistillata]|uniref:poly [ADP-ribose] polymerase 9-like n=1 Tax=Stylophora pistillata TaxID=50429 RepID=UPI000C056B02|nr:poly [ADP-ribose] polymerase 9-like [Stylophora pistillata]